MKFQRGNCVKNKRKKSYSNGDVVKIGTKGSVLKVYQLSESYSVLFADLTTAHRILEIDLNKC